MADQKPALVLHLAAGGNPVLLTLAPEDTESLGGRLASLLTSGGVESVPTAENGDVAVDFGKVAVAYIDDLARKGTGFGLH